MLFETGQLMSETTSLPAMNHMASASIWEGIFAWTTLMAAILSGAPIAALGVIWAPYAAILAALLANANRLSPPRYFLAGFALSVLYLLPWVYLMRRMGGGRVPPFPVYVFYVLFYIGWAISILYSALFGLAAFAAPDYEVAPFMAYILLASAAINAAAWVLTLTLLTRSGSSEESPIPAPRFTTPLAVALTSLVINNVLYWSIVTVI